MATGRTMKIVFLFSFVFFVAFTLMWLFILIDDPYHAGLSGLAAAVAAILAAKSSE